MIRTSETSQGDPYLIGWGGCFRIKICEACKFNIKMHYVEILAKTRGMVVCECKGCIQLLSLAGM